MGQPPFDGILDLAPAALAVTRGPDHVLELANPAFIRLVGDRPLIGRPVRDALPEVAERGLLTVMDRVFGTGDPFTADEMPVRLHRGGADGSEDRLVSFVFQPLRNIDGEVTGVAALGIDVTEPALLRDAVRAREEERLRAVVRATDDVIWDWDPVADTVWWSDNLKRVFDLTAADVGPSMDVCLERIHPEDRERVRVGLRSAVDGSHDSWAAEYRFIRGDGRIATVFDRGTVIRQPDGRARRMVGAMMDMTERRRLEDELRQAQKLEAVGKLAGGIAHDFNNLLTVIRGYAELVLADLGPDAPSHGDVDEIRRAADRAATLTRQLLAFSRRQVLQPRILDLSEIVGELDRMLRRVLGEDVRLVCQSGGGLHPIHADPGQIEQIIMNLAVNARDAMPGGGTLTIATENAPADGPAGEDATSSGFVLLTVSDTGVGMDAETLAQLFEPFFTTKRLGEGTGLGLSTVHGIVTQSGGRIDVESEPGKGSTFRLFFPVAREPARGSRDTSAPPPPETGSGTVLLVEDERGVREIAARTLERHGYSVLEAADGREALEVLEAHTGTVDLVLSDLVMPDMDGRELAACIRALELPVPVIFMSGYAEGDPLPATIEGHEATMLRKPFTAEQLVAAVADALDAASDPAIRRRGSGTTP